VSFTAVRPTSGCRTESGTLIGGFFQVAGFIDCVWWKSRASVRSADFLILALLGRLWVMRGPSGQRDLWCGRDRRSAPGRREPPPRRLWPGAGQVCEGRRLETAPGRLALAW